MAENQHTTETKRLFVGLQIYGDQANRLDAMSRLMFAKFTGAAGHRRLWEPDGTGHRHPPHYLGLDTVPYHITLRFLGSVDVGLIPNLETMLERMAENLPPFTLYLSGCGVFQDRDLRPRFAWIGVHGELDYLRRLHTEVLRSTAAYSHGAEEYLPHVTVGRFDTKDAGWAQEMARFWQNIDDQRTESFLVDEVLLYASERDDGKVTYAIQGRWPLNPDQRD